MGNPNIPQWVYNHRFVTILNENFKDGEESEMTQRAMAGDE